MQLAHLVLLATLGFTARTSYAPAHLLTHFQDARINESSGLAASGRSDAFFWTHNDSGDSARVFAVNRQGETLAVVRVQGAQAIDWEDMARGVDEHGQPALFLGDIGDNGRQRPSIFVYRIPEPEIDANARNATVESAPAVRFELRYPNGAHDAETLLVHPKTGQLFVVTKAATGSSVYASPTPPRANGVNPLTKVGEIRFVTLPATPKTLQDQIKRLLATGGALSPEGDRVVVRTYTDAYEWTVPSGGVGKAFASKPLAIPLPPTRQGEAITYTRDGAALLVSSEGIKAPLHELQRR